MVHSHLRGEGFLLHCLCLILEPQAFAAQFCQLFIVHILGLLHLGFPLIQTLQLAAELTVFDQLLVLHIAAGSGLIHQVDGLVRQVPVGDIPLSHHHAAAHDLVADLHMMVVLIILLDALQHLHRVLDGRLIDRYRLEPALQSRILFDVAAVLIKGGGADDLDLAPGQRRLEDIGGIHRAFRIAGSHQVVDLINEENHIARLLDIFHQALDPAFELAPELGTCHQGSEISLSSRLGGTLPSTSRWAMPSAMAVLPTPGSPIRQGLFLVRRLRICITR